jgi:hypothetical protein
MNFWPAKTLPAAELEQLMPRLLSRKSTQDVVDATHVRSGENDPIQFELNTLL